MGREPDARFHINFHRKFTLKYLLTLVSTTATGLYFLDSLGDQTSNTQQNLMFRLSLCTLKAQRELQILPPATVVAARKCFHKRVSRILPTGGGACVGYTPPRHGCPPGMNAPPGMHTPRGTHTIPPGMHAPLPPRIPRDAVNEQAVRILLEGILVK